MAHWWLDEETVGELASGFRLAAAQLDRLDTKSAFDLEE